MSGLFTHHGGFQPASLHFYTVPCNDALTMPYPARPSESERRRRARPEQASWDRASVRALRRHLGFSQRQLAEEMGVRQQTVSEWETGAYRPRGASARLLTMVAERAEFEYEAEKSENPPGRERDASPR